MDVFAVIGIVALAIGGSVTIGCAVWAAVASATISRRALGVARHPAAHAVVQIADALQLAGAHAPDLEAARERLSVAAADLARLVAALAVLGADVRLAAGAVEQLLDVFAPSMRGRFAD